MEDQADLGFSSRGNIQLVVFDLDGTLVDTISDLAFSVNTTLARHGWPIRELIEIKSMVGDGFAPLVERALPQEIRSNSTLLDLAIAEASAHYAGHSVDRTLPYPGIEDLLAELRLRGIACAVLSNKAHEFTARIVERLFPRGTFRIVQGEMSDMPKKPHPQAALSIAARTDCLPANCILVGDSPHDMEAARAAGMRALGAGWGYRTAAELYKAGAQKVLISPMELLDFI